MKIHYPIVLATLLSLVPAFGQFGPSSSGPRGPHLNGSTAKLFGDNASFSATMTIEAKIAESGAPASVSGKLAFDQGKSRFEIDLLKTMADKMPPAMVSQMKEMGMDQMVVIATPDKKTTSMIYPGLKACVEMPSQDPDATKPASDFKLETTELGKETVDGHACIKNKAILTDKEGVKHEATVWNATDLKQFPIKIEQTQDGKPVTMVFKEIKLAKPDASLFAPPAGFAKYDNMQSMMQEVMMKKLGGMAPPTGK